jgi:hypothetical protein
MIEEKKDFLNIKLFFRLFYTLFLLFLNHTVILFEDCY